MPLLARGRRSADAKCVVITFSYPNSSTPSMLHVTRPDVLKKHHTHAGTQAGSRTHGGLSDVIFSNVSCVPNRRARRWLRVQPGLRLRRQSRVAPGIRKPGTSSRTCELPTDRRSPLTDAHPTRPLALRTTRS